jgi:hypothetical protein
MMDSDSATPSLPTLHVGLPLQLTVESGQDKVNCSAMLLGWKDKSWLICEWPLHLGRAVPCEAGTRCLVRYLVAGKLIGYESEVLLSQTSPVPLLYLAFPRTVEELHLRKHVRVPSNEPILLIRIDGTGAVSVDPKGDATMGGLVQDLSVAGCQMVFQQERPDLLPGATVRLEFELIGIGHVSHLTGVVKNAGGQDDRKSIGIEFRFGGKEYIEYRGWGGSVQKAIEYAVLQRDQSIGGAPVPHSESR